MRMMMMMMMNKWTNEWMNEKQNGKKSCPPTLLGAKWKKARYQVGEVKFQHSKNPLFNFLTPKAWVPASQSKKKKIHRTSSTPPVKGNRVIGSYLFILTPYWHAIFSPKIKRGGLTSGEREWCQGSRLRSDLCYLPTLLSAIVHPTLCDVKIKVSKNKAKKKVPSMIATGPSRDSAIGGTHFQSFNPRGRLPL